MVMFLRRHPLASFVVLTYAISWAAWLPLLLRGAIVVPGGAVTHFPGLLGPAAAAFIITAITEGRPGVGRLLERMRRVSKPSARFLRYSLSPLAFLALALLVARLIREPIPPLRDFGIYSGLPVLPLIAVVLLVLLFNGFGEETGWRGFALERLQRRFGPVRGTLALGLIWAGWHTPAFWFVEGYRALWHAIYNLTSATTASRGVIGAVTTSCVIAWAVVLLFQEWRSPPERSRLAVRTAT